MFSTPANAARVTIGTQSELVAAGSGRSRNDRIIECTYAQLNPDRPPVNDNPGGVDLGGLLTEFGIPLAMWADARRAVAECLEQFRREAEAARLPAVPKRDFRARESIIAYLKSDEGFGPWLRAGELNRPLLRKLSPRAYMALANWLRSDGNTLEAVGLDIPTKAEMNQRELESGLNARDRHRLAQVLRRRGAAEGLGASLVNGRVPSSGRF